MASEIPPDIITEILYYLPAKSAGRFRCVSKEWKSLLSSPHFIKTHQIKRNQNHIISIHTDASLYSLPLNVDNFNEKTVSTKVDLNSRYVKSVFVHGSCNGLVLVSSVDSQKKYALVLFNPMTRELTEIGLPSYRYDETDFVRNRFIMIGFGYDSLTDDYKITLYFLISLDCMIVHVYSLKSSTWKQVDSCYNYSFDMMIHGVFVDGFIHCFAKRRCDGLRVILGFSLADEKFNEVPSPDIVDDDCKLVDLGGKLGIFLKSVGEVWLMNEYGVKESWTNIILEGLNKTGNDLSFGQAWWLNDFRSILFQPMIYKTGKIVIVANCRSRMFIFDNEGRCFLENIKINNSRMMSYQVSYVESLVSPKLIRNN
ncbi:F-box/kelch-repeat protein At3g06240-like [Rutidosis leptorrhynchoides]|uniref:F-box/kelch-repeat protein At3g06240-like n=1 Tax=Rutidosis leptorrhynchoides TaxID=125765 RepID=UPI003A99A830